MSGLFDKEKLKPSYQLNPFSNKPEAKPPAQQEEIEPLSSTEQQTIISDRDDAARRKRRSLLRTGRSSTILAGLKNIIEKRLKKRTGE